MLQTISATKARENFAEIINRVMYGDDEFIIEKQGKPAVKIVKIQKEPTKIESDRQKKKATKKFNGREFLFELTKFRLKGPKNFAKNHDQYIWENYRR